MKAKNSFNLKMFLLLALTIFIKSNAQSDMLRDSLVQEAKKRFPMLEICKIPGYYEPVLCGTLQVYENHNTKTGKKIPIEVVVLPTTVQNPEKSAFTYHWGGNGGAAKDKIWMFQQRSASQQIRNFRDVVLIDDRGTGASNIRCAAMDSLKPYSYALAYDEDRIKECQQEVKKTIALDLYTTPFVVQDYEAVREWLGLAQYDFFGSSYGTRVGLEYMRRYPNRIRTLTVKGLVPPGFDYVNEMDLAIQEQLEILTKRCVADSICNSHYPNFKKELYEVRNRLKENPKRIDYELEDGKRVQIEMTDLLFRRMVGHQILNGDANEALPLLVNRAYHGNYAPLIVAGGSLPLDMPVFLSQFCPEEVNRFTFDPKGFGADGLFTQGAIGQEKVSACDWWMDLPEAKWLDEPLQGESPILILTSEYDANTPIKMGEQIKKAFPGQSRHIVLPHNGHAGNTDRECRYNLISQFIESKNLETLDTTCLSQIKPNRFQYELPLTGEEFKKYEGEYQNEKPEKALGVFSKNGVFYLMDEYSQYSGPSQLLYKGENTFNLLDCSRCQVIFDMADNMVQQVTRIYRETDIFEPKKME